MDQQEKMIEIDRFHDRLSTRSVLRVEFVFVRAYVWMQSFMDGTQDKTGKLSLKISLN